MELVTSSGRVHPLKMGVNTVGRAQGNDIVLEDGSMSRQHAELHWDGQWQCLVVDLGSTNGTYLNGRRLLPHQPQPVQTGASLGFGPTMAATVRPKTGGSARVERGLRAGPAHPRASGVDLLFRALDAALDHETMGLAFLGFLAAGIVGFVFTWLATQVLLEGPVFALAIGMVGLVAVWILSTAVIGAVTRLILVELRGHEKIRAREALGYARGHAITFLLSPVVLGLGLALVLVAEALLLLVGRIEYIGELVVSVGFLPLMLLNLAILVVGFFGGVLIFPTIADRGGSISDTIVYVLTLVRRAPIRLVAYSILVGLGALLTLLSFLSLMSLALYTTVALTSAGMGPFKFAEIFGQTVGLGDLLSSLPLGLSGAMGREAPVTYDVAGFLYRLSLLGLLTLVLTIPQVFYLAGISAVYLNLSQGVSESGWGRGLPGREAVYPSSN